MLYLKGGAYSLADKQAKRMLQCFTNTYPTQALLHLMDKARQPHCPFCTRRTPETLSHWQQLCTGFHDVRTKVHNDIWAAIYTALKQHMPDHMDSYREVSRTELMVEGTYKHWQPDGIFVHKEQRYWTLVDYTRGSCSTREDLRQLEEAKCIKYSVLVASLQERHTYVEFIPLASTYN